MAVRIQSARRWEAAAIVAILLGAAALRLLRLSTLPPGLHQDEAVYGVDAETVLGMGPRIYYGEREPLFMYLATFVMLVLGPTPLALRTTAALVGVVGAAAGGAFARQLFGRTVGLLTAAGLAASLWLTAISRVGYRAITFPTVECLGLALLWRATRTGRRRDYAIAGAVLGLCLYTYLSSRFLPFALLAFLVIAFGLHREWIRKQSPGLVLVGVVAVVVCLPLGAYALRHPEMLLGRPDQVALPGGSAFLPAFLDAARNTLGMLFFHGDRNWRQNYSGAPVFDPLNSAVFLVGLILALRWRRPATFLTLALLAVMLLPSMLSIDSPHYLRTGGAAVAIYTLWAIGLAWIGQTVAGRFGTRPAHHDPNSTSEGTGHPLLAPSEELKTTSLLGVAVIVLGVTFAFARTGWTYFVDYARNPEVPAAFNTNLAAAGQFLASSPMWKSDRSNVYVTDRYRQDRASVAFFLYPLLAPAERPNWLEPRTIGRFFSQQDAVPLPAAPSLYVVDGNGQATLDSLGPSVQRTELIREGGLVTGRAIYAAPASADWFGKPVGATFGRWLELERVDVRQSTVGLRWKILAVPDYQPSVFVHVRDAEDHTLATADQVVGFSVEDWRVGQEFVTWHPIHLPPGTLPGSYSLTAGVYRKETGVRESALLGGKPLPSAPVGALTLAEVVGGSVDVDHHLDRSAAPGLTLVGFDLTQDQVEAGTKLSLTLVWQTSGGARGDAEATISLKSSAGPVVGTWRGPVGDSIYPASRWPVNQMIRQLVDVPVDATASGPSTIVVAVRPASGDATGSTIEIAPVTVKASNHQYLAPRPQYPSAATFSGVGTLVGYDLPERSYRPGESVPLTLYWRSDGSVGTSYTVFVHLLDSKNKVVEQRDEQPNHGSRPTTSWVPREYVADEHDVPIDPSVLPGTYQIEVGLYDPKTGQRVATGTPDNRVLIGSVRLGG